MVDCAYKNEQSQCSHKNLHTKCQVVNDKICGVCKFQSRLIDPEKLRSSLPEIKPEMMANPEERPPSLIEMGTNFIKSTAKHIMNGAPSISKEVYDERLAICNSCEHRSGNHCNLCGCNLTSKLAMPTNECPIKKWLALRKE